MSVLRSHINPASPEFRSNREHHLGLAADLRRKLEEVRFVGISTVREQYAEHLPFPLQHWLVLERAGGRRVFVKPNAVRMYEETGER